MYLKSTVWNSIFVLSISMLGGLVGYLFRILLAHNLDVQDYGLFYSMFSFLAFFTIFIDAGLTQSVAKTIVEFGLKKKYGHIKSIVVLSFACQLLVSLVLGILFFLLFPLFSVKLFQTSNTLFFLLLLCWFITLPLDMFLKSFFWGLHFVKLFSSIDPLKNLLALGIAALLFHAGMGTQAPFIAYAAINLLVFVLLFPILLRFFPQLLTERLKLSLGLFKPVMFYGWCVAFSGLAWALIMYTDTLMISYFRNLTEVGFYQIAMPLSSVILYFVSSLNIVAYPLFSKLSAQKESAAMQHGITLLYNYLFVGMIPLVLIMFTFPELVITVLFGSKFVEAATALRVLTVGMLFFSLASFNTSILSATGKAKAIAKVAAMAAILNIILNLVLIRKFGYVGASFASAISFAFLLSASLVMIKKAYDVQLPLAKWTMNFIVGLLTVGVIWYLKNILNLSIWLKVFATLIPAGIFYIALLILFKVINFKEFFGLVKQVIR